MTPTDPAHLTHKGADNLTMTQPHPLQPAVVATVDHPDNITEQLLADNTPSDIIQLRPGPTEHAATNDLQQRFGQTFTHSHTQYNIGTLQYMLGPHGQTHFDRGPSMSVTWQDGPRHTQVLGPLTTHNRNSGSFHLFPSRRVTATAALAALLRAAHTTTGSNTPDDARRLLLFKQLPAPTSPDRLTQLTEWADPTGHLQPEQLQLLGALLRNHGRDQHPDRTTRWQNSGALTTAAVWLFDLHNQAGTPTPLQAAIQLATNITRPT